jgi:hypothetical protein
MSNALSLAEDVLLLYNSDYTYFPHHLRRNSQEIYKENDFS